MTGVQTCALPIFTPCYDPLSHLVYAAGREHVSDVWVAGRHLIQGKILKNSMLEGLDTRAKLWQNTLRSRTAY